MPSLTHLTRGSFTGLTTYRLGGLPIFEEDMLHQVSITLTHAQIKALPTTGQTIINSVGASRITIPIFVCLSLDWKVDYDNIDAAAQIAIKVDGLGVMSIDNAVFSSVAGLLAAGEPAMAWLQQTLTVHGAAAVGTSGYGRNEMTNAAVTISATNGSAGDFTMGSANGTLLVNMIYAVLDMSLGTFV